MSYKFNPFTGTLDDVGPNNGNGVPGGANTQVQFNDGGVFGGDVDLTWNKTTNILTVAGDVNLSDGGAFTTTLQTITPTANRTISLPDATGTVALVGGSSGQLLWNNAGVNAGASTLTYDGSILTTSGRFINSYNATASAPAKTFTGTWFTGGTSTTTKPQVLIEPTGTTSTAWSTSGTGLGVNAASGFAGNLLDLQVNGTSRLKVDNAGIVSIGATTLQSAFLAAVSTTVNFFSGNAGSGSGIWAGCGLTQPAFAAASANAGTLYWQLWADAANTLAQRNGTSAQVFRVYNTYTSSTNYELGKLEWTSNTFRIGTEKGSGGGTARNLELQTDGTTRATVDTSGRVLIGTTVARTNFDNGSGTCLLQIEGTDINTRRSAIISSENSANGASLILAHQRSGTIGGNTILQAEDFVGSFQFQGSDGSEFVQGAYVAAIVDGAPSANDMPTRLQFAVCPDGNATVVEALRITNDRVIGYNQSAPAAVDTTATLTVANLKTGIITSSTAAAVTMTLPTGTLTEGGFSGLYNNFTFEWTVINTGATNAVTVQGGTDHTLVGSGTVAAGVSGRFASRRTAANTFVTYRLS